MKQMTQRILIGAGSVLLIAAGLTLVSCSTPASGGHATAPADKDAPVKIASTRPGGAQLWERNCGHCHNVRSPASYSDAQWEVVMLHMRVRANLTAEEHKQILALLKSAH